MYTYIRIQYKSLEFYILTTHVCLPFRTSNNMKILHETIHWITQGVLLWKQIVDSTTDFHSPKLRGRPILREVQNLRGTTSTMSWTSTLIYACRIMYI